MEPNTAQAGQPENMEGEKQTGEKTFTQEEVSRMMKKTTQEQEAAYQKKMQELHEREMRLLMREKLAAKDMPKELADVLTCTDEKDLDSKLETIKRIYGSREKDGNDKSLGGFRIGCGELTNEPHSGAGNAVRRAMGLH